MFSCEIPLLKQLIIFLILVMRLSIFPDKEKQEAILNELLLLGVRIALIYSSSVFLFL